MTTQPTHHRPRSLATAATTLHRFLYLVSALPLAGVWIVVLVGGWALSLGLAITPLVFGVLIGFGVCVRFMAWVEGFLARRLLRAPAYPRRKAAQRGGYWRAAAATLRDGRFWRGQAFGWLRVVLGLLTGVLTLAVITNGLGYATAPLWYRFIPGDDGARNGIDLGVWQVDTLGESFLLMPAGVALLAAGIGLINLFGSMWRRIAVGVLGGNND
jgi:hypothetical protein